MKSNPSGGNPRGLVECREWGPVNSEIGADDVVDKPHGCLRARLDWE